jgi:hypothetical protein
MDDGGFVFEMNCLMGWNVNEKIWIIMIWNDIILYDCDINMFFPIHQPPFRENLSKTNQWFLSGTTNLDWHVAFENPATRQIPKLFVLVLELGPRPAWSDGFRVTMAPVLASGLLALGTFSRLQWHQRRIDFDSNCLLSILRRLTDWQNLTWQNCNKNSKGLIWFEFRILKLISGSKECFWFDISIFHIHKICDMICPSPTAYSSICCNPKKRYTVWCQTLRTQMQPVWGLLTRPIPKTLTQEGMPHDPPEDSSASEERWDMVDLDMGRKSGN